MSEISESRTVLTDLHGATQINSKSIVREHEMTVDEPDVTRHQYHRLAMTSK